MRIASGQISWLSRHFREASVAAALLIVLAAIDPAKVGIPASIAQSETFSLYRIVAIVALTGWTTAARLVRAETLSLKQRDFARAAQALGARPARICNIWRSPRHLIIPITFLDVKTAPYWVLVRTIPNPFFSY